MKETQWMKISGVIVGASNIVIGLWAGLPWGLIPVVNGGFVLVVTQVLLN